MRETTSSKGETSQSRKRKHRIRKSMTKINIGEDFINKVSIKDVFSQKELQQFKEELLNLTRKYNKSEEALRKQKTNTTILSNEVTAL